MSPEQILIPGALLVAGAFAWRAAARARTSRVLRRAARDPRRWVRRAAIEVMAEQGLHRFGKLLAERIEVEDVPAVREALALAIVRNQWEPADSLLMMRLRLWAHLELEVRREVAATPEIGDEGGTPAAIRGRGGRDGGPPGDAPPPPRPLQPIRRFAIRDSDSAVPPSTDGAQPAATVHRLRRASGQR